MTAKYEFWTTCVGIPRRYVPDLIEGIEAETQIYRDTFMRRVDRAQMKEIEVALGYTPGLRMAGLRMAGDWHVTYWSTRFQDQRAYWFRWSGIEYIFLSPMHLSSLRG